MLNLNAKGGLPQRGVPGVLAGLAALLALAVGAMMVGPAMAPSRSFHGALQATFPTAAQLSEWKTQFLPVAESAEMQRAVAEMLNFDQAAFARYTQGSVEVSLYAAYWSPGKMSHRLIAGHKPDVCWVGAGWERVEARQTSLRESGIRVGAGLPRQGGEAAAAVPGERLTLAGTPWEYRKFTVPGRTEDVVFLHLVGGAGDELWRSRRATLVQRATRYVGAWAEAAGGAVLRAHFRQSAFGGASGYRAGPAFSAAVRARGAGERSACAQEWIVTGPQAAQRARGR